jgi:tRNA threonylcarbamoyladenosine biosynthesis protein TsaB
VSCVLAIASATGQVGVAVSSPAGSGAITIEAGRRHGETLAPALEALTALAGCPLSAVDLVAVDAGPGLFTGLRVGVATAKALAAALGVPVAAGCSLDILAAPHRHCGRPVVSVVDARRSEVFWAAYGTDGRRLTDPAVIPPAKLALTLAEYPGALVVGDGARRYADLLGGDRVLPGYDHPSAAVLATMAPELTTFAPELLQAVYLRGPDVRIGWETR